MHHVHICPVDRIRRDCYYQCGNVGEMFALCQVHTAAAAPNVPTVNKRASTRKGRTVTRIGSRKPTWSEWAKSGRRVRLWHGTTDMTMINADGKATGRA